MSSIAAYIRDAFLGIFRRVGNAFKSIVDWLRLAYSPHPYWRGNMLTVRAHGNPPFQGQLKMVISQVFQSSRWNVMEVSVMRPSGPPVRAVLKMFDRRFAPAVRDGIGGRAASGKWSPEIEEEFVEFVRRGAADDWSDHVQSEDFVDDGEKKNELQKEVERHLVCKAGLQALLAAHQKRKNLPRAYSIISIPLVEGISHEMLVAEGILMEYVPGFNANITAPSKPSA
ncbi:uncharacterized protein CTRU02_208741 [Colletotrichum truncatum]|uniref:Uncharacterized protein n=1 Tax=Colletotrichum truncatum TaxID=5467 RepID=A0ACC3YX44_COLTU|nr:uncharacterized protein CTRU02_06600 [Colletotrichum truncatum]KAF6792517.1 hypothetical protein CTRU02_06600 [Colletotrichum truncatum]